MYTENFCSYPRYGTNRTQFSAEIFVVLLTLARSWWWWWWRWYWGWCRSFCCGFGGRGCGRRCLCRRGRRGRYVYLQVSWRGPWLTSVMRFIPKVSFPQQDNIIFIRKNYFCKTIRYCKYFTK